MDNIGGKIKSERLKKSLKQYELAEKAGISNRTSPSLKTLDKIAKALEVNVKVFL